MNEVKTPKKPLIVYYAIAILVVLLINTLLVPMVSQARVKYVDYGTFIQMTEEDKISEVQVQDNQIVFITKEDEANKNAVYYRTGKMDDPELTSRLSEHGVRFDKEIVEETSPLLSFLLSFVFPIVLFIALGQLLTRQMMKRMGGGKDAMSFGMGNSNAKVYVKDSAGSIKFDDVAGEDEAKENLSEIVNYLHDPSKYRDIGASMPKGILLVGPAAGISSVNISSCCSWFSPSPKISSGAAASSVSSVPSAFLMTAEGSSRINPSSESCCISSLSELSASSVSVPISDPGNSSSVI